MDWTRRIASKGNIICSANGITGSGKSSFLSSCCLKLSKITEQVLHLPYKAFSVNNVYYEPEEMQERIKNNLKYGEILLRDEHLKGQAGMMSDLTANFLTDAEQQLRKKSELFFSLLQLKNKTMRIFTFLTSNIFSIILRLVILWLSWLC